MRGGQVKVIASIEDSTVIGRILGWQTRPIGCLKCVFPIAAAEGSDIGLHILKKSLPTVWYIALQPPTAFNPMTVTVIAPPIMTNICSKSV